MYGMEQRENTRVVASPVMKNREPSLSAPKRAGSSPYSGRPLRVSGSLARHIKDSFGIDAGELSMRESPEVAEMGARATAQGNVIRFAPGEFRPDTSEGLETLGHELSHVREQARGGVRANMPGSNIHYDAGHEAASDRAGEAFASGGLSAAASVSVGGMNAEAAPVQGSWLLDKLFGFEKDKDVQRHINVKSALMNRHRKKSPFSGVDSMREAKYNIGAALPGYGEEFATDEEKAEAEKAGKIKTDTPDAEEMNKNFGKESLFTRLKYLWDATNVFNQGTNQNILSSRTAFMNRKNARQKRMGFNQKLADILLPASYKKNRIIDDLRANYNIKMGSANQKNITDEELAKEHRKLGWNTVNDASGDTSGILPDIPENMKTNQVLKKAFAKNNWGHLAKQAKSGLMGGLRGIGSGFEQVSGSALGLGRYLYGEARIKRYTKEQEKRKRFEHDPRVKNSDGTARFKMFNRLKDGEKRAPAQMSSFSSKQGKEFTRIDAKDRTTYHRFAKDSTTYSGVAAGDVHNQSDEKKGLFLKEHAEARTRFDNRDKENFERFGEKGNAAARFMSLMPSKELREQFAKDFAPGKTEDRKKHLDWIFKDIAEQVSGLTPDMGTEKFLLNNYSGMRQLMNYLGSVDDLLAQNPDYEMDEKQKNIFETSKESVRLINQMLRNLESKYGVDAMGGDVEKNDVGEEESNSLREKFTESISHE